jgi:hypothetical protein
MNQETFKAIKMIINQRGYHFYATKTGKMAYQKVIDWIEKEPEENQKTFGALKRIIEEVKEKRAYDCPMKDCVTNQRIGGDDIQLVEKFIKEQE